MHLALHHHDLTFGLLTCTKNSRAGWIGLCSVLRPRQHSIGYMGNSFYRSKDSTNSIKIVKENLQKKLDNSNNKLHICLDKKGHKCTSQQIP